MSFKNRLSLIILLTLSFSCSQKQEEVFDPAEEAEPQTENHFLINSLEDTIPTDESIPARGKWINPDSVVSAPCPGRDNGPPAP